MSISAIAKHFGEIDTTMWSIFNHQIEKAMNKQFDLSKLIKMNVDETAIKRGYNYVTKFTDADTGDVIFVTEGRKQETFGKLYEWLFEHMGDPNYIKQFVMDMSKSYKAG